MPAQFDERQHEREERGLDGLARGEKPARPAPDDGLVAKEEIDQQVDPRRLVDAARRLCEIAGLEGEGDPSVAVGRVGLVCVLGQPDVLRPEVSCHVTEQALQARHRQPAGARQRLEGRLRPAAPQPVRVRVMGVDVEPGAGETHSAHERYCREGRLRRARRCGAAGHDVARVEGVQDLDCRVQQPLHVEPRRVRVEAASLVRLVPDLPLANPRVAQRSGGRERRQRGRALRRPVRLLPPVRPAGSAPERQHDVDPVGVQPGE